MAPKSKAGAVIIETLCYLYEEASRLGEEDLSFAIFGAASLAMARFPASAQLARVTPDDLIGGAPCASRGPSSTVN